MPGPRFGVPWRDLVFPFLPPLLSLRRLLVEAVRSPELRLDRNFLRQPGSVERASDLGQV